MSDQPDLPRNDDNIDPLGEPTPNLDKPSKAEGDPDEQQGVSPIDPAADHPSQAEGDEGDDSESQ